MRERREALGFLISEERAWPDLYFAAAKVVCELFVAVLGSANDYLILKLL